ncbi:MAG: dihydrodipicolinate synthase family protein [Pseudomonadota bacterium]|nr:dihydrodipicolinate synthase family protein [Pseudomonadota bacterium]MEC8850918.1 dihydrodipicolinate synthase family protein [Pseudomonadota bacterium]
MSTLHGVIPPATTPFDAHGDIQFDAAGRQIKWLIENGAQGVAVGGSTGEGQTLDREEFRDLIAASTDAAAGQVPVIAGIITDSTREAVIRGKMIRDLNTAALQVTPVHYLFKPSDDAMVEHFRTLAGETGQKIIIYNVVPWTYLSPALLLRIMDEVPDVIGVKQSAGDLKLFADLMADARPGNLIFSAVDALMYPSYTLGAHGSIAAILSAAPRASVDLWDAVKAGDHARAHDLHLKLLALWNALMPHDNLPASTKFAQSLQGCPAGVARQPMAMPDAAHQARIKTALDALGTLAAAAE